jgi:hypothetical protein
MIGHNCVFHLSPGGGASMGVSKTSLSETKAKMEIKNIREKSQAQLDRSKTRIKKNLTNFLKYSRIRDFETFKVRSK